MLLLLGSSSDLLRGAGADAFVIHASWNMAIGTSASMTFDGFHFHVFDAQLAKNGELVSVKQEFAELHADLRELRR